MEFSSIGFNTDPESDLATDVDGGGWNKLVLKDVRCFLFAGVLAMDPLLTLFSISKLILVLFLEVVGDGGATVDAFENNKWEKFSLLPTGVSISWSLWSIANESFKNDICRFELEAMI